MILKHRLKAEDVRQQTMKTLTKHMPLHVKGYSCTTEMIFDVVLKASAESSSLDAACEDLESAADGNTVRAYLNDALTIKGLTEQEEQMNQMLAESIPSSMKREDVEIAIDYHDEPFYGKSPELVTNGASLTKA